MFDAQCRGSTGLRTTCQTFVGKKHNSGLAHINQASLTVCTTVASGKEFAKPGGLFASVQKSDGLAWMDYLCYSAGYCVAVWLHLVLTYNDSHNKIQKLHQSTGVLPVHLYI